MQSNIEEKLSLFVVVLHAKEQKQGPKYLLKIMKRYQK